MEFKEHNSVSKRSMFPWRSRNHRQSERGELSLGSSMCKLESLSLRKVLTVKKKTKKHTSIELPRSTLPGKVPFSLWFHGDPNESTVCPRVHEGPLYLLFTSLHGRETSEGGEEGREYQLSFQPSAMDCQRLREYTHGQATLPKSASIHLLLRDLSHPQTFRFPWQAYNRSMFHLTLDVQWYWLGAGQDFVGSRGFLLFRDLCSKTPRVNWEGQSNPTARWTESPARKPGGHGFLWKQDFGTEASEAAIIPKGFQRVPESLLWGSSDLMII